METTSRSEPQAIRKRHSVFGLISSGMGLIGLIMGCAGLGVILYLTGVHQGRVDLSPVDTMLAGLCAATVGPLAMMGIGGGIVGFVEPDRRRVLAWIGIALNVLSLLILAATIVLGAVERGPRTLPPNL